MDIGSSTAQLLLFGFQQSTCDHCLFIISCDAKFLVLWEYVDDILLIGNYVDKLTTIKKYLHYEFTIKDLGRANYFLDIEIVQTTSSLKVSQNKFILGILQKVNPMDVKPALVLFL